jgi:ligand-binding sensor domain-containing protein
MAEEMSEGMTGMNTSCGGRFGGLRLWPHLAAVFFLAWILALPLQGLDSKRSLHQYGRDRWTRQTGLPGSVVSALYQSPDGYLWLHCGGELYRFDGVRFSPAPLAVNGQSLGENIRAVGRGRDGKLLLRTSHHTLYLDKGHYTDVIPATHLPDGSDRVVTEARDGSIWLGTDNHIYRYRSGTLELIASGVGWVRSILEDHNGIIWVAGSSALYRIEKDRVRMFPTPFAGVGTRNYLPVDPNPAGSPPLPQYPSALLEDRDGVVWIGTLGGLWKWKNGNLFQDEEVRALGKRSISTLLQDRDGNIWAGTDGQGLFRFALGRWSSFTTLEGLSDDTVLSLREDMEGSLWIGTRTALDRLRNAPMRCLTGRDGLSSENTASVLETRDGSVFVYTFGGGITRWKDGVTRVFTTRDGLGSNFAGCLFESRDGTLWAGTDKGLSAFRNGQWQTYTGNGKLTGLYIAAVSEDEQGLILGCSDLNIYRFRDGQLSPYELNMSADGKPAGVRYTFAILPDRDGTQWFALSGGLYRVGKGQNPASAMRMAFTDTPLCLFDDGQGYLWMVGSNTGGFTRLNKQDGSLIHFPPEAGAKVDGVGRILCDQRGNLWMNTRGGIVHFDRAELDAFAQGRSKTFNRMVYGTIDGLRTEDCGGMTQQPSAWRGRDGRLFFTSRKGLVVLDPDPLRRNALVPQVHIEEVVVDKQVQVPTGELVCQPGLDNLEIHYSATSLQVPSRVHFRYQLMGFDPDWVDAGTRRTAYYTHIPPGTYRFRVIACNDDGLWNEVGATLKLQLRPHFYQTLWFLLLCIAGLGALGFGLHLIRTRRMRFRQMELEALVGERTRELDQHRTQLEALVE